MSTRVAAGRTSSGRWVPIPLVALVLIPAVAGSLRLIEVAGGPQTIPSNPRLVGSAVPLVIHILSAILYGIVGAFQFSAGFRRRRPGWHRVAGRVLVVLGLAVAGSALWINEIAPRPGGTGELLYAFRLVAGSAMAACLVLGFTTIRRRDVAGHRAWMTRAYALALAAGTQVFTLGVGQAIWGTGDVSTALMHGAGWVINLAVAENVIRRHRSRRPRRAMVGIGWS